MLNGVDRHIFFAEIGMAWKTADLRVSQCG